MKIKQYRFLLSSQWLGYLALAAALATVCVFLGNWQLDRRATVVANIQRIEANYDAAPRQLAPDFQPFSDFQKNQEWTPVQLTGTYDGDAAVLVRNRPLNGKPGFLSLVPFRLADGSAVIISRGWSAPSDSDNARPANVLVPPTGEVTITARVRPGEPEVAWGAPEGQLASINLKDYQKRVDYPLATGAYGALASESPAPPEGMPPQQTKPALDEGPHLSYAMQWFAFAVMMFIGYGYAAWAHARNERLAAEEAAEREALGEAGIQHQAVTIKAPRKKPSRKPTAEDEEDALLDAQGYR